MWEGIGPLNHTDMIPQAIPVKYDFIALSIDWLIDWFIGWFM